MPQRVQYVDRLHRDVLHPLRQVVEDVVLCHVAGAVLGLELVTVLPGEILGGEHGLDPLVFVVVVGDDPHRLLAVVLGGEFFADAVDCVHDPVVVAAMSGSHFEFAGERGHARGEGHAGSFLAIAHPSP
jgi:hypothetical protein